MNNNNNSLPPANLIRSTKPKEHNILKTKNHYFPEELVGYVNEIQRVHDNGNMNESAKIAALKSLFQQNEFTQLLTLLNARRKIMLKEFEILNAKNNALTKNNNKLKNIGETIDALTALVNEMKRMKAGKMKQKNVPLLSTIHGNAQLASFGFMNRKEESGGNANNGNENNNRLSVQAQGSLSRFSSISSLARTNSTHSILSEEEEGAAQGLHLIPNHTRNRYEAIERTLLNTSQNLNNSQINQIGEYVQSKVDPHRSVNTFINTVFSGGFKNKGFNTTRNSNIVQYIDMIDPKFANDTNKCYRNVALHLFLPILRYVFKNNQFNNRTNNSIAMNTLFNMTLNSNKNVNKGENHTLRTNLLGILKGVIKPVSHTKMTNVGNLSLNGRTYTGTGFQETNEYINDMITHFFSEEFRRAISFESIRIDNFSTEKNLFIHIHDLPPEKSDLDFQKLINEYLSENILKIPDDNKFLIIQTKPYNEYISTRINGRNIMTPKPIIYGIDSPLIIRIYNAYYQIHDISYFAGGVHYVNHSYRKLNDSYKWYFYDDMAEPSSTYEPAYIQFQGTGNYEYHNRSYIKYNHPNHTPTTLLLQRINVNVQNQLSVSVSAAVYHNMYVVNKIYRYLTLFVECVDIEDNIIKVSKLHVIGSIPQLSNISSFKNKVSLKRNIENLIRLTGGSMIGLIEKSDGSPAFIEIRKNVILKYVYMYYLLTFSEFKILFIPKNGVNNTTHKHFIKIMRFLIAQDVLTHNMKAINKKNVNIHKETNLSSLLFENNTLKNKYQTDNFIVFLE